MDRRRFLALAGSPLAAPATARAGSRFLDAGATGEAQAYRGLQPLTRSAFVYHDACQVYVLRKGAAAILIDLGSGRVLDELPGVGIRKVEAIYLTHRDRDQWFGWSKAQALGIPIHAPALDPEHFGYTAATIRRYWTEFFPWKSGRWIYSILTGETDYATTDIRDGMEVPNEVVALRAVATPGHTDDHVAYLANLDGLKLVFSGDAVYAAGKVWQGYQLDWDHWRGIGYETAARSVLKLRELQPDLVAPSHGVVMKTGIEASLLATYEALWKASQLKNVFRYFDTRPHPPAASRELKRLESFSVPQPRGAPILVERLSQSLWISDNNYFLIADDGSCLAVDNCLPAPLWDPILARIGAKSVDLLWPTHLHADHVTEYPELKKRYGVKVITIRQMAELLENPLAYWQPYSNYSGVKADQVLEDGESFTWKGHTFRAHHAPGQTLFHAFLETVIDGRHSVFAGDGYWPNRPDRNHYFGTGGWSGLNRGFPLYYSASARLMREIRPHWVLSAHGQPYEYNDWEWQTRVMWGEANARHFDSLSPSGSHWIDFNPHAFSVYPLRTRWRGRPNRLELRVSNPLPAPMEVRFRIDSHTPVDVVPKGGFFVVAPKATEAREMQLRSVGRAAAGRQVVPVEIEAGGRHYGQAAFFLVDVEK